MIKKDSNFFKIARDIRFLLDLSLMSNRLKKRYPKILQLPITYKCDSRCKMCNIWKMSHSNEMSVGELGQFLKDPIFKKIESVGINGGEPSLIPNLTDYAREVLKLPKLKSLDIISNGFNKESFLKSLQEIYKNCRDKGIRFHVSISLDGVGRIHDAIRGKLNVFEKTVSTIDEIVANQGKYCDSIDVGCTIIQQNVDYLIELDAFSNIKNYVMKYRLGIDNKRIESDKLRDDYSVICNSSQLQSAKEFMYSKFCGAKNLMDKFKYFSIFYWLNSKKPKRLLGCAWKDEGITMDARGDLYYCAVASKKIGSLRKDHGKEVFFNNTNIEYKKGIINNCDGCIHDYSGRPEFRNIMIFFKEFLADRLSMRIYKFKCNFGLI